MTVVCTKINLGWKGLSLFSVTNFIESSELTALLNNTINKDLPPFVAETLSATTSRQSVTTGSSLA